MLSEAMISDWSGLAQAIRKENKGTFFKKKANWKFWLTSGLTEVLTPRKFRPREDFPSFTSWKIRTELEKSQENEVFWAPKFEEF
jgi:predicted metalloprotease with PDZ domain